jgi:hypothetical protein
MRKLIFLLFGLLFFNLGCDDGSVGGGGRVKVVATLQTPLSQGNETSGAFNLFRLQTPYNMVEWSGTWKTTPSPLIFTTDEVAVTQGQNWGVTARLDNLKGLGCQQVKIETFLNGALFDTRTYNMGFVSLAPTLMCSDGNQISYNLIIP